MKAMEAKKALWKLMLRTGHGPLAFHMDPWLANFFVRRLRESMMTMRLKSSLSDLRLPKTLGAPKPSKLRTTFDPQKYFALHSVDNKLIESTVGKHDRKIDKVVVIDALDNEQYIDLSNKGSNHKKTRHLGNPPDL